MADDEQGREAATADPFAKALGRLGPALLTTLDGFERVQRRLHPPEIESLKQLLTPLRERLAAALVEFTAQPPPEGLESFALQFGRAAEDGARALSLFCDPAPASEAVPRMLQSMSEHCCAQESLYPLRKAFAPANRFFLEEPLRFAAKSGGASLEDFDPEPREGQSVGIHAAAGDANGRGGFSLYVPERYDGSEAWPLVVALHGGGGQGRDFLWSWLREARSRRFLLLAPTSRGSTWSLNGPDLDAGALRNMVEYIGQNWRVDPERILLTGLSDGATYTLLCGLQASSPFTALAPLSGVLHPTNFRNGNLERASERRIYLVHGALDWMFPVQVAQMAAEELEKAGASLVYREIEDLSHTYARDENARILEWFDPGLALS
jgi:phospholipase/carboxylesterase